MKDIVIFSGSAHQTFANQICEHLGTRVSPVRLSRFSNDCLQAQLLEQFGKLVDRRFHDSLLWPGRSSTTPARRGLRASAQFAHFGVRHQFQVLLHAHVDKVIVVTCLEVDITLAGKGPVEQHGNTEG